MTGNIFYIRKACYVWYHIKREECARKAKSPNWDQIFNNYGVKRFVTEHDNENGRDVEKCCNYNANVCQAP